MVSILKNKQNQKTDTTSEDQLFMTRNFVFGPEKIPKGPKNKICLWLRLGTFIVKEYFWAQRQSF